jgi:electron transport complex protein RnfA
MLFAIASALLLTGSTLLSFSALAVSGLVSGLTPALWLTVLLSSATTALLLLPLSAWFRLRTTMISRHRQQLLAGAGIEVAILTSVLLWVHGPHMSWLALLWVLFWSICAGLGLLLAGVVFADLRLRLRVSDAPASWRGLPLELMTAGILALALLSPTGGVS